MSRFAALILFLTFSCPVFTVLAEEFNIPPLDPYTAQGVAVPMPRPPERTSAKAGKKATQPVISGDADMLPFFHRLESIGLDTREIRAVTGKVEVFFRKPSSDAEAGYSYISDNLYIPYELREANSKRIRFALETNNINTLLHEYVHAARDVSAGADAPRGTPGREQYEAESAIQADLRSQALFYRYSGMKANEVSAYFMGAAIAWVFTAANDVVFYNTKFNGSKPSTVAEAERLGGLLILPSPGSASSWERMILNSYARFGQDSVYDDAKLNDNVITGFALIHWPEREFIKENMYNNILGLKPPKTLVELVERLNTIDNDWIRGVRREVAAARLANARKAEAQAQKN